MKKLSTIALTLALTLPAKAEMPKEVYSTIDQILQTRSNPKTKRLISSLADQLGDNNGKTTNDEMVYALDIMVSKETQRYISKKLFGESKIIDDLSIIEKGKIKLKYPQIPYIVKLRKRYLNR
ncbi:hypothetical protein HN865_00625 [Candidatus Woesearchaeota archaeon]|jgi:hypothetical protein|nr:hypothetical protein [Candidatus Woesearchaeota archaeon]MBT7237343.1 hypothetical protein [Candidatus Woesearchaeota archaeon]